MSQVTNFPVAPSSRRKAASLAAAPPDTDLATASSAPQESARTLERALGHQVRILRRERDLTAAELGQAAGISLAMVSKIENGQISPSLSTINSLANALNVPFSSLFSTFEEKRDCSFFEEWKGPSDRKGRAQRLGITTSSWERR